jgi:hypothetical protein
VPYVRVTRDERGYETTFLLHVRWPGDRPQVLYWYRSAPGVRVGRPALDEEAIRAIEEQHPEIEFDWDHLIESSTLLPPEMERRPERPRRKRPADPEPAREALAEPESPRRTPIPPPPESPAVESTQPGTSAQPPAAPRARNILLEQLVGREIAARLRARYAELLTRVASLSSERRGDIQAIVDTLDPDAWQSPETILDGVQNADRLFDELRRQIEA